MVLHSISKWVIHLCFYLLALLQHFYHYQNNCHMMENISSHRPNKYCISDKKNKNFWSKTHGNLLSTHIFVTSWDWSSVKNDQLLYDFVFSRLFNNSRTCGHKSKVHVLNKWKGQERKLRKIILRGFLLICLKKVKVSQSKRMYHLICVKNWMWKRITIKERYGKDFGDKLIRSLHRKWDIGENVSKGGKL